MPRLASGIIFHWKSRGPLALWASWLCLSRPSAAQATCPINIWLFFTHGKKPRQRYFALWEVDSFTIMSLTTTITLGARQEFWNADTGEIICNMTAAYGDEKYFLWRIDGWPAALIFKGLVQRRKFSMKRTTSPFSPVSMDTRWLQYIAIMNMSIIASIIIIKDCKQRSPLTQYQA